MKCWTTAIPSLSRLFVLLSGGFLATILVAEDRPDLFLHVLTATDVSVDAVPRAAAEMQGNRLQVTVADVKLSFRTDSVGGDITWRGAPAPLAESVASGELLAK